MSGIMVFHHTAAILIYAAAMFFPYTALVKTALTLGFFITWEHMTFIGLVMYRLHPKRCAMCTVHCVCMCAHTCRCLLEHNRKP